MRCQGAITFWSGGDVDSHLPRCAGETPTENSGGALASGKPRDHGSHGKRKKDRGRDVVRNEAHD